MPDKETTSHHKRYAVRATNHATGEVWAIADTKTVCERELAAKLDEWGKNAAETATVEGPLEVTD